MTAPKKRSKHAPTVGLALSGGSAWGMAHIGALKALAEADIQIDCVAGTSAGALAAAFFAFGIPVQRMEEISRSITWKTISKFTFSKFGISTNLLLQELIEKELGTSLIEKAKIPLAIVATDIETGERKVFREGPLAPAVRASTAIPGAFTPVEIEGTYYVDGGIAERLPIHTLKEMGADITIGVHLSSPLPKFRPKNVRDILVRSMSILSRVRDVYVTELADILIEPNLSRFSGSDFGHADNLQKEGYRAAIQSIPEIRKKLKEYNSLLARAERKIGAWLELRTFQNRRQQDMHPRQ
ncbi:patatin-like phospholipase family protein [Candidatus Kaiserbacteria bacterium]|nr:patatin-like phospholipase family protein [Candidatus Kaiserbacteria bacterium]